MDQTINYTIRKYIKLIKKKYTDIEKAYLFGSYAKGLSNQDSDIDLVLVFRKLDDSRRFDTPVELMIMASQIDSRIEPHPISLDDFNAGNPFVAEIQNTGIEIDT